MIRFFAILLPLLCQSCSIGPTVKLPEGGLLTTGASLFSKSTAVRSSVEGNGYKLSYETWNNDETVVPEKGINGAVTASGIRAAGSAVEHLTPGGVPATVKAFQN